MGERYTGWIYTILSLKVLRDDSWESQDCEKKIV